MDLKFKVTEQYLQNMLENSEHIGSDSLKPVIPFQNLLEKYVTILFDKEVFSFQYVQNGNTITKNIYYIHILRCMEVHNGLLLTLVKKKYFFLPVGNDQDQEKMFRNIYLLLRKKSYKKFEKPENLIFQHSSVLEQKIFRLKILQSTEKNCSLFPKKTALAFSIVCVFIGTVFLYHVFSNRIVDRSDALSVTGEYLGYETKRVSKISKQFYILLSSDQRYHTAAVYSTNELSQELKSIDEGEQIELLIHPYSSNIIELKAGGKILLEFEATQKKIFSSVLGFLVLTALMYSAPVIFFIEYKKSTKISPQN